MAYISRVANVHIWNFHLLRLQCPGVLIRSTGLYRVVYGN